MEKQAVARLPAQTLLDRLHRSVQGLNRADVAQRRRRYGLNALTTERATARRILARQFQDTPIDGSVGSC